MIEEIYSLNPYSSLRICPKCNGQFDCEKYSDITCYDYYKCMSCKYSFKAFKDYNAPINAPPILSKTK
jgi:hypothetical protein